MADNTVEMGDLNEVTDEMRDLNNSVAFNLLEDLCREGLIPATQMEILKAKYRKQHELVLATYDSEKFFLRKAKDLNHKLMREKVKLEKGTLEAQESQSQAQALKTESQRLDSELELALEREAMLELQSQEMLTEKKDLVDQIAAKKAADQAALRPIIEKLESDIRIQKAEVAHLNKTKREKEQQQAVELAEVAKLKEDLETTHLIMLEQHDREFNKIKNEPARLRKQVEKYENALQNMTETNEQLKTDLQKTTSSIDTLTTKRKETEELRQKATMRLQLVTDSVQNTSRSAADLKRRLEREKNIYTDTIAKRVGLDLELRVVSEEIRHGLDEKSNKEKLLDRMKRDYRRREGQVEAIKATIPPLISQKEELAKEIVRREEEMNTKELLYTEIQNEVDVFIGAYLKQEVIEKEKREELESLHSGYVDMRADLQELKKQNSDWEKHLSFLEQARDKLTRDDAIASKLAKETWSNVQMRELEEFDLKKKLVDVTQRQKEFCAAYEVVKNERNKYVALIQAGSQKLSEMREKLKVLANEVEILKLESGGKDKTITDTEAKVHQQRVIRDQFRMELTKIVQKINTSNNAIELYVTEIDKLNNVINQIEREVVELKRKYEVAVQQRNQTGIQLIDRNDELCILWEKSNIHEFLLKKGEMAIQQKMENLRCAKIDLAELNRRLVSMNRSMTSSAEYTERTLILKDQLREIKKRSEQLSSELENPSSKVRKWRFLHGSAANSDADKDTLRAKQRWLEERLSAKEEQLLEKELIVEEVTALSEKLRLQAIEGRQGTLKMSQKVNAFQSKLKDVTRSMMATVSELSMYQATKMKLDQECVMLRDASAAARVNLQEGMPPTEQAESDFQKHLRQEHVRRVDLENAAIRRQEEQILESNATRTTAEPRVNAYIASGEFGLPKAYGKHTPFMPSAAGATMRHIRNPNPRPVEI